MWLIWRVALPAPNGYRTANELTGRFHLDRRHETTGLAHLRNARAGYDRWGAAGKVRQLDQLYPQLAARDANIAGATPGSRLAMGSIMYATKAPRKHTAAAPQSRAETIDPECPALPVAMTTMLIATRAMPPAVSPLRIVPSGRARAGWLLLVSLMGGAGGISNFGLPGLALGVNCGSSAGNNGPGVAHISGRFWEAPLKRKPRIRTAGVTMALARRSASGLSAKV